MRRVARNVVIGALTVSSLVVAYALFHRARAVQRVSLASAYVALALLGTSLILGPLNVLRDRANPVSYGLRRDIGIWAAIVGLAHVVAGIQVHLAGRPWLYFVYDCTEPHRLPLRHDIFGLANYSGLVATLLLALLLALSNDRALRKLGTPRWKRIQRYNYLCFAMVAIHAAAFQIIETRWWPLIGLCGLMISASASLQVAGYRHRSRAG